MTNTILVVDNFDSFVYNLVQYCEELGADLVVRRSDAVSVDDVASGSFAGVLISPGPGHPREATSVLDIIRYCATAGVPLLGVCLGHQALAEAFGYAVGAAPELLHGRASSMVHDGEGVFAGLPSPLIVGRYHSLAVDRAALGDEFTVTASAGEVIMGMRHRTAPLEGVQFHPESVLTQGGYLMLASWLERCGIATARERAAALSVAAERRRAALPNPPSA